MKDPILKILGTYLIVLFLLLLMSGNALGQTKFCKQDICVVEFNAYLDQVSLDLVMLVVI